MSQFAEIIPCLKLPRRMDFFDYKIPEGMELNIGSVVNIPYKNKVIQGVVARIKKESNFENAKEIIAINELYQSFVKKEMDLLDWLAGYYFYSRASLLKLILPTIPKRKSKEKFKTKEQNNDKLDNVKIDDFAKELLKSKEKKYLLFPYDREQKIELYRSMCQLAEKSNSQILILFPLQEQANNFVKLLGGLRYALITSELHVKKNDYYNTWQDIKNNQIKIIVGTRSAVFVPFVNIKTIVIDSAESDDYKQWDQNPRYEAVNVVQKIQELTDCTLVLASLSPRIEDVYKAKQDYKLINLGKNNRNLEIINLKNQRNNPDWYLSDKLAETIAENIENQGKTLLIVNKKGSYSHQFCADCLFEPLCPNCQLPLVATESRKLVCYHCHYEEDNFLSCPKCHGLNIKKTGIGIEQIRATLERKFKIKVALLDEKSYESQNVSVYLSTGYNLTQDLPVFSLLGFVYIDSLLYLSDFNANFSLYSYIQNIVQQTKLVNKNNPIIIQTGLPDNIVFKTLSNYKEFYTQEIESRKSFGYPPFKTLIKLIFDHFDLSVARKEAERLYAELSKTLPKEINITEPYLYYARKVRNRYRYQICLFIPPEFSLDDNILKIIPEHWHIDRNPVDLL